jgi:hypothetical protein
MVYDAPRVGASSNKSFHVQSPGPGSYNCVPQQRLSIQRSAPKFSFGSSRPPSAAHDGPGPGAYTLDSAHAVSTRRAPSYTMGTPRNRAARAQRPDAAHHLMTTPGPGAYMPVARRGDRLPRSPSYTIGTRSVATIVVPVPSREKAATYIPIRGRTCGMDTSTGDVVSLSELRITPAPGDYNTNRSAKPSQPEAPHFSFASPRHRPLSSRQSSSTPGPGAYFVGDVGVTCVGSAAGVAKRSAQWTAGVARCSTSARMHNVEHKC